MDLDHLAISAVSLAEGAESVEDTLGVRLAAGGRHAAMGTHNRLLGLGPVYLEVIAIDPSAEPPGRPRWFDLDRFHGAARLTNWVARCDDLDEALRVSPDGSGAPMDLARGDLRWRMAVPADGRLPFGGMYPALIQWQGAAHPCQTLPDSGCRLAALELCHPQASSLRSALAHLGSGSIVSVTEGAIGLRAEISTPHGTRILDG